MGKVTRAWALVAALATVTSLSLVGCGRDEPDDPRFVAGSAQPSSSAPAGPTLAVTPVTGAKKQPVSTEIAAKVEDGKITEVILAAADGSKVSGELREDGSSWVPARPLKYGTSYTATVTATGSSGGVSTETTTFSTMAKPGSLIGSGLYLFDDRSYGVAMPVVVEFSPGIPKKDRAAVQRRMFVRTDPPQPGVWHWLSNGTQAYYRGPHYWKPETKIMVRIALEGIPLSNGRYGNTDRRATAKIGRQFEMKVQNASKKMSVYENGRLVRTIPVSLGKASTPSSSGTMVVMDKLEKTVFDTRDDPDPTNRYVTDIEYAQRLTWGGEYIHAAPWSVGSQGRTNVSHGCVNVSTENAKWLFSRTRIGDPITVSGTERKLAAGNGWTAWNLSWERFIEGSALPVPAELRTAG